MLPPLQHRPDVAGEEATLVRAAELFLAVRRHVPRDMAVACVGVVANVVATTRLHVGERHAYGDAHMIATAARITVRNDARCRSGHVA